MTTTTTTTKVGTIGDLDPRSIDFFRHGSKMIAGDKTLVQTPRLRWLGVKRTRWEDTGPEKKYAVFGCEEDASFREWCARIDEATREAAVSLMGDGVLQGTFHPLIRDDSTVLRISMAGTTFFGPDERPLEDPEEGAAVGDEASLLLAFEGAWFINRRYGPYFKLLQVKFHGGGGSPRIPRPSDDETAAEGEEGCGFAFCAD